MHAKSATESHAGRKDDCTQAQHNQHADQGWNLATIQKDEDEQVTDQAGGGDQNILTFQPFEGDRAADGPIDGIDSCGHGKFSLESEESLNN